MFHEHRRWAIIKVESDDELAEKLAKYAWTRCTGFELSGYLFLNDATGADGAQEFAVVEIDGDDGQPLQLETITTSWCNKEKALGYIRDAIAGRYDRTEFAHPVPVSWEPIERHGRCHLCA